ncbi:hypothetical protein GCM10022225_39260 [Plantactinospora mayteni]|uniref:Transposase n=1 Tax=Plantactinospora mayteni TaxID=566021 RepID=A0ABQ4EWK3_9ACTN|nr:hypothetical protein [Plantactinospora mayteni]GIG99055.1 hypothetical protein Pma05_56280 [Plantactinospora mayteni]
MKRLLRHLAGPLPYHRRDWRRLWRYCRCGWRWRCPDAVELVPTPYQPPPPVELTEVERAEIRCLSATPPPVTPKAQPPATPEASPPPARGRASNRRPEWDAPTRSHLANGRAGGLTPAQEYRARRGARV